MRVSKRILSAIKKSACDSFGPVPIYLFGSRVNDNKKGGDIDIAVDCNSNRTLFKKQKIKFITSMILQGFDLKIDLVSYNTTDKLLFSEIRNSCVKI